MHTVKSPYEKKVGDVLGTVKPVASPKRRSTNYRGFQANEKNWTPQYTKILLMTQSNKQLSEIAKETGLTVRSVQGVRASTFFVNKLASLNTKIIEKVTEKRSVTLATDKAREIITKAAIGAARKVISLSKNGEVKDRVQLLACQDIMDRAGLKPIEIIESRERVYSVEEVQSARAILAETEEIVARLSNQTSPFVIDKKLPQKEAPETTLETEELASSMTEDSSDETTQSATDTKAP